MDFSGEPPGVRREMAELWAFRALAEASAGRRLRRVADGLARLGADAALVALARRAPQDEERHRRLCLDIAASFGPCAVPALVPTEVEGPADATRERVIFDVVSACCVSETLNLRAMTAALVGTKHEGLRKVQREILRDEVGHSALGWRFLEAEARRGDLFFLGPLVPQMLGLRSRSRLFRPAAALAEEGRLRELGWLPREALRALFQKTLADRVFPRLEAFGVRCDEARAALASALAAGAAGLAAGPGRASPPRPGSLLSPRRPGRGRAWRGAARCSRPRCARASRPRSRCG